MSELAESIIVIKKKRVSHGGHHGGAWKVAYADFVTAMMSFFMVMWLMGSSESVKKSVASYFQDPKGTSKLLGSSLSGAGNSLPLSKEDMNRLKEQLLQSARQLPNFEKLRDHIDISASPDGLRIELLEDSGGTFFQMGSAIPTPALQEFLGIISHELGKMPNRISIEGHTDSVPYAGSGTYTNWELSADRANAARRLMQSNGIGASQIAQVRGFANQLPRKPDHPEDPSNRRITVIVDSNPVVADASHPAEAGAPQSASTAEIADNASPKASPHAFPDASQKE